MDKFKREMREYLEERDWLQHNTPANVAKSISIEAAELLELFQWSHPTTEEVLADPELKEKISGELADVLTYCFNMAVVLDLDVDALLHEKLESTKKKYPAGSEAADMNTYWRIKKEHRRNNA